MRGALAMLVANFLLFHGLTSVPRSSWLRPLLLLPICGCCFLAARSSLIRMVPGGVGIEYAIGSVLQASNFLCLANLGPGEGWTAAQKWSWGWSQVFSPRWGVARPGMGFKGRVPSRKCLFVWRAWDAVWTLGIIWAIEKLRVETFPRDFLRVPNGFVGRLGEVDRREAVVRMWVAVDAYVVQYCSLRACHSIVTCVGMLCGQDPKLWPPLFGDIREAYTLRRWFG